MKARTWGIYSVNKSITHTIAPFSKLANRKVTNMRLSLGLIFLSGLLSVSGCNKAQPPVAAKKAANNLQTTAVTQAVIPQWIHFDGSIEALNQATISAQTAGRVTEVGFDVGDYVSKGQRIVTTTSTQQGAQLKSAQSQVTEAKVRADEAKRAFDRAKSVFEKKLISQADFDKANSEHNAAIARLNAAIANVKSTEQNLAYTRIDAPYAGIVLERHVQVGEAVSPGTPLITGLSLEHLRIAVNIPQTYITPLREQGMAEVILNDQTRVNVTDIRFPPSADATTQSFRVLLSLPSGDYTNLPGTLVKVRFKIGKAATLVIPTTAVIQRGEMTAVYVVNEQGIINLRYIHLGASQDDTLAVLAGLNVGETIALNPQVAAAAYLQQNSAQGNSSKAVNKKEAGHE